MSKNDALTHLELLSKLEPRLAKRYKAGFEEELSVLERFKKVDAPFYQANSKGGHTTVTESGMILQSMNIPLQESMFEKIERREYGPIQSLEELGLIREELKTKTFDKVLEKLKKNQPGGCCLLGNWSGLLANVDFSKLTPSEQVAVLKNLQNKRLTELSLVNCEALTDGLLEKINVERVRKIDLKKITS